ncbi:MAG: tetraacyldisaccharide 4'-kinase [Pseudorhodoplanes sp.]
MRDPAFWWRKPGLASRLLAPVAAIYGAVAARRMARPGYRARIPVFCIGNFTLGGAGKTPTALAVARLLIAAGERPFFLSRGYGGALAGPLRVEPATHRAADIGDEPLLLARMAPTIVARDRKAGAEMAQASGASLIIMDDGLQNPSLEKDLSLAVVDGRRGIGNGSVFPAGPLRAPLAQQIAHVDAVLLVGGGTMPGHDRPVFTARLEPDPDAAASLQGKTILAFAGIGDPQKFFETLSAIGARPGATESFPDHHRYSRTDTERLLKRAARDKLILVTTEKDLARMAGDPDCAALWRAAQVLPVTLAPDDESAFRKFVLAKIGKS